MEKVVRVITGIEGSALGARGEYHGGCEIRRTRIDMRLLAFLATETRVTRWGLFLRRGDTIIFLSL